VTVASRAAYSGKIEPVDPSQPAAEGIEMTYNVKNDEVAMKENQLTVHNVEEGVQQVTQPVEPHRIGSFKGYKKHNLFLAKWVMGMHIIVLSA